MIEEKENNTNSINRSTKEDKNRNIKSIDNTKIQESIASINTNSKDEKRIKIAPDDDKILMSIQMEIEEDLKENQNKVTTTTYLKYSELPDIKIIDPNELLVIIDNIEETSCWMNQIDAINKLRSLNKYNNSLLLDSLHYIIPHFHHLTTNLKSNISKNSLILLKEITNNKDLICNSNFKDEWFNEIINISLIQSTYIKSFISIEAQEALKNISKHMHNNESFIVLLNGIKNTNHKISENAYNTLIKLISNISIEFLVLKLNWKLIFSLLVEIHNMKTDYYIKKVYGLLKKLNNKVSLEHCVSDIIRLCFDRKIENSNINNTVNNTTNDMKHFNIYLDIIYSNNGNHDVCNKEFEFINSFNSCLDLKNNTNRYQAIIDAELSNNKISLNSKNNSKTMLITMLIIALSYNKYINTNGNKENDIDTIKCFLSSFKNNYSTATELMINGVTKSNDGQICIEKSKSQMNHITTFNCFLCLVSSSFNVSEENKTSDTELAHMIKEFYIYNNKSLLLKKNHDESLSKFKTRMSQIKVNTQSKMII